ncbi:MAG: hypothetical protein RLZZ09_807 [Pseudomonadota bacterium]|jgi:hypothetical protein
MSTQECVHTAEAISKINAWSDEFMDQRAKERADERLQYLLKLTRTIGRPRLGPGTAGGQQVFLSIFCEPDHPRWLRAQKLAAARINQLAGRSAALKLSQCPALRREEIRRKG